MCQILLWTLMIASRRAPDGGFLCTIRLYSHTQLPRGWCADAPDIADPSAP